LATPTCSRRTSCDSSQLTWLRGNIPKRGGQDAIADLEEDFSSGRLQLVDMLWCKALLWAADLSRKYTPNLGTRTLDVLHVASAQALDCRVFVTYDDRQAKLARATYGARTFGAPTFGSSTPEDWISADATFDRPTFAVSISAPGQRRATAIGL